MNARALYRGSAHILVSANEEMPEPFRNAVGQPVREVCSRRDCAVTAAMDLAYATGEVGEADGYAVIPVAIGGQAWGVALVLPLDTPRPARLSIADLLDRTAPAVA